MAVTSLTSENTLFKFASISPSYGVRLAILPSWYSRNSRQLGLVK